MDIVGTIIALTIVASGLGFTAWYFSISVTPRTNATIEDWSLRAESGHLYLVGEVTIPHQFEGRLTLSSKLDRIDAEDRLAYTANTIYNLGRMHGEASEVESPSDIELPVKKTRKSA